MSDSTSALRKAVTTSICSISKSLSQASAIITRRDVYLTVRVKTKFQSSSYSSPLATRRALYLVMFPFESLFSWKFHMEPMHFKSFEQGTNSHVEFEVRERYSSCTAASHIGFSTLFIALRQEASSRTSVTATSPRESISSIRLALKAWVL